MSSVIEFTASPSEVIEGLTSSVTVRCSLKDKADDSVTQGCRDVIDTQGNMAVVTSIIIMKSGQTVAAVSQSQPARQVGGNSSLQVTGSMTGSPSGRGFLEITILNPAPSDIGEFKCQVNGETSAGGVVSFFATVEVNTWSPTTVDLVKYIRDMKQEIEDIKELNKTKNQEIKAIKELNEEMKQEMKEMKQFDSEMTVKEENMNSRMSKIENKTSTVSLFSVGLSKKATLPKHQVILYDKIFVNIGNEYNIASGEFVCRVAGYYQFAISAFTQSAKSLWLQLQHNKNDVISIYGHDDKCQQGASNSVIIKLSSGDTVRVIPHSTSDVYNSDPERIYTTFTGHLVATL